MKLCPNCGRHHRGVHCVHQTSPRSRSAILGSLLGLGALGVGCSSSQNPEVTDATVANESAPNDDSAIADPSTSVDPAQVLARPTEPIIPEGTVMVPVYGIPPMPEPVPPVEVIDEEGSGESDETGDGSGLLPVEIPGLNPWPLYGVPSRGEDDFAMPRETDDYMLAEGQRLRLSNLRRQQRASAQWPPFFLFW